MGGFWLEISAALQGWRRGTAGQPLANQESDMLITSVRAHSHTQWLWDSVASVQDILSTNSSKALCLLTLFWWLGSHQIKAAQNLHSWSISDRHGRENGLRHFTLTNTLVLLQLFSGFTTKKKLLRRRFKALLKTIAPWACCLYFSFALCRDKLAASPCFQFPQVAVCKSLRLTSVERF